MSEGKLSLEKDDGVGGGTLGECDRGIEWNGCSI